MPTPRLLKETRLFFPFGVFALVFSSISLYGTLLLKHPANAPGVITLADYLLAMGMVSMPFVLVLTFMPLPPNVVKYNIVGLIASFFIGLGFIAFLKALPFSTFIPQLEEFFTTFFFNDQLATLATVNLPTEVTMFFVASIEELTFRVAIPVIIIIIIPVNISMEARWVAAMIGSSTLFGMWHIFAYSGSITLMATAIVAGVMLSFAYQVGVRAGGGDLAFIGIVIGHYFWNVTMAGLTMAIPFMLSFMFIVIAFAFTVSPESQRTTMIFIGKLMRSVQR